MKLLHFSRLENNWIGLGKCFLASLSLVDTCILSNSCWLIWTEVKNLDLFKSIPIWKIPVAVSTFSSLSYFKITIKALILATKDGLCGFLFSKDNSANLLKAYRICLKYPVVLSFICYTIL